MDCKDETIEQLRRLLAAKEEVIMSCNKIIELKDNIIEGDNIIIDRLKWQSFDPTGGRYENRQMSVKLSECRSRIRELEDLGRSPDKKDREISSLKKELDTTKSKLRDYQINEHLENRRKSKGKK